jgi:hypothetical protein
MTSAIYSVNTIKWFLWCAVLCALHPPGLAAPAPRPNVIFILADDLEGVSDFFRIHLSA